MRLTFPYVIKPNCTQKEIIEDIIWHCEKVYNTLMSNNINVEMTSCSEINISCYIDRDDVKKAQVLLHEAFLG